MNTANILVKVSFCFNFTEHFLSVLSGGIFTVYEMSALTVSIYNGIKEANLRKS